MKRIFLLTISLLLFITSVDAKKCVVDAQDKNPISSACIFDAEGNMIGVTWLDGDFTNFPESVYPITIRCIGYEQLVIERPEQKTWEMTPIAYELSEVVIVPVKRNILKQIFYVREYFSMYTDNDTVTTFKEHMAHRFAPATEDAKFSGSTSLRVLDTHHYSRYKLADKDSIITDPKATFPSMITVLDLNDEDVTAHESFKESSSMPKIYEEPGKSGIALIQKQNAHTFTTIEDVLSEKKGHKYSPIALKALGMGMEFNQLYTTHIYRANDKGIYQIKDLLEVSLVMEADGTGKLLRKIYNSDKPVDIRCMIEIYVVDKEYLSQEEAKEEYKNPPTSVEFVIPSTVPPLNEATQRIVDRTHALRNQ